MTVSGIDLLVKVHREFEAHPTLHLTLADAQLRWNVEVTRMQAALQGLVVVGYLQRSASGVYSRERHQGDSATIRPPEGQASKSPPS